MTHPRESWSWYAHAPLKGGGLQREAGRIHAWDDAGNVYLIDRNGKTIAERKLEDELAVVVFADTADRLAAIGKEGRISLLSKDYGQRREREAHIEVRSAALDPFGEYLVISGTGERWLVVDMTGRILHSTTVGATYSHLSFAGSTGRVIGASDQGRVACHALDGTIEWKETMYSTLGSLAVDAAGEDLVLACFGHGVIRFAGNGRRVGNYQLDRTPRLAAIDADGARLAVVTTDEHLIGLSLTGETLFDRRLPHQPVSVAVDPLCRFVVIAFSNGQFVLWPWEQLLAKEASSTAATRSPDHSAASGVQWSLPIVRDEREAAGTLLEPIGSNGEIAVFSSRGTLRILNAEGSLIHESEKMAGAGRSLKTCNDWICAATDRRLAAFDARTHELRHADLDLYDISHLFPLKAFGDQLVIESCDQVQRVILPKRVEWKHRLETRVASAAAQPTGELALVLDNKELVVLSEDGKVMGRFQGPRPVTMLVIDCPRGWVTASLDECVVRVHAMVGTEVSAHRLPWEPWGIQRVGDSIVVTSADGCSALLAHPTGRLSVNSETRERARYFTWPSGEVGRVYLSGNTLIASTFEGKLRWRRTFEGTVYAFAASPAGVWVLLSRDLQLFPAWSDNEEHV